MRTIHECEGPVSRFRIGHGRYRASPGQHESKARRSRCKQRLVYLASAIVGITPGLRPLQWSADVATGFAQPGSSTVNPEVFSAFQVAMCGSGMLQCMALIVTNTDHTCCNQIEQRSTGCGAYKQIGTGRPSRASPHHQSGGCPVRLNNPRYIWRGVSNIRDRDNN